MKYKYSLGNLKYKYRFFFTLDYLLKKIGINFITLYIYSINLDDFVFEEPKNDNIIIKECKIDDLPKFGKLNDLFLSDMQKGHILIGVFLDDEWIGYVWISLKPIQVEEVEQVIHFDGAYLWRGHIKKEFRQRGIYKKMLQFSLNQIKNKYKKDKVYGIIEISNIPSIKGVESLKFSRIGTIKYSKIFLWKKYEEKIENNTVTLLEV
jgi:ribosomal protein S18 acetylase RimI-like enzyme